MTIHFNDMFKIQASCYICYLVNLCARERCEPMLALPNPRAVPIIVQAFDCGKMPLAVINERDGEAS